MRVYYVCSVIFAAGLAFGCAPDLQTQAATLVSMTPTHFEQTASISDGDLETMAVITTENGFKDAGALGPAPYDSFLRAFIDKKSGAVSYQVYVTDAYDGANWRFYDHANFKGVDDAVTSVPVISISQDVVQCDGDTGNCLYDEDVGIQISSALLQHIAGQYQPGAHNPWLFKIEGRIAGADFEDGIMPAEALGLTEAVSAYETAHHLQPS